MENQLNTKIEPIIDQQEIISLERFIIFSLMTLGLYHVWWVYKSWRFFKQKENSDIMPAVRTIVAIVFLSTLFDKILSFAKSKGYTKKYSSNTLFAGFFLTNLLAYLPNLFWLLSLISVVFLIPPFKALNYAKQNSTHFITIEQPAFKMRHVLLIVFGTIFWILLLIGMYDKI